MENRKLVKMHLSEGAMFKPQKTTELGTLSHMVLELKIEERGYGICPQNKGKVIGA